MKIKQLSFQMIYGIGYYSDLWNCRIALIPYAGAMGRYFGIGFRLIL
jgi:hypothetical protein